MKKIIIVVLTLLFVLTSCGEITQTDAVDWQGDELYAVAYIGYLAPEPQNSAKNYLDFENELPTAQTAGDEWYLIIPRYSDTKVSVFEYDLSDVPTIGEEIAVFKKGQAFLLRCNQSDIMPNTFIQLKSKNGEATFSPCISLKGDGEPVVEIDKGVDITK